MPIAENAENAESAENAVQCSTIACSHCGAVGQTADGVPVVRADGLRFVPAPTPTGRPVERRQNYLCGACEGSQLRIRRPGPGSPPGVPGVGAVDAFTDVLSADIDQAASGSQIAWFRREDAAALGFARCAVTGRYFDLPEFDWPSQARGSYVLLRRVTADGVASARLVPLTEVSVRAAGILRTIADVDWARAGIDRPADLASVYAPSAETHEVAGVRYSRFWSTAEFHSETCPRCGRESMQPGREGCEPVDVIERADGVTCCGRCCTSRTADASYGTRRSVSASYVVRSPAVVAESQRLFPPSMTIGAELEAVVSAGAHASRFVARLPRWGWCHDGSISVVDHRRRHAGWGVEFLAPIMQGPAVAEQFGEFADYWREEVPENEAARRGWCWVNKSCGYHVHFGAREFTPQQIAQVISAWLANQSTIYRTQPASRQGRYSAMISADGSRLDEITTRGQLASWWYTAGADLRTRIPDSTFREHYHSSRYHGLNVHSFFYRGTLEVRLGAASTDSCKLRSWASLMARFVSAAAEADSVEAASEIRLLSTAQRGVAAWARRRARSLNRCSLD